MMSYSYYYNEAKRASRFILVGIVATMIHAVVYLIMTNLEIASTQTANLGGFAVALCFSYFGQKNFTFADISIRNNSVLKLKFLVSALCSFSLNSLWVWINDHLLMLNGSYAVIGIVFITPIVTLFLLKMWVFRTDE